MILEQCRWVGAPTSSAAERSTCNFTLGPLYPFCIHRFNHSQIVYHCSRHLANEILLKVDPSYKWTHAVQTHLAQESTLIVFRSLLLSQWISKALGKRWRMKAVIKWHRCMWLSMHICVYVVCVCVCVCVVGREGGGTLVRTLGSFFGCVLFSFLTPPIASGSSQAGDPTRATEVTMLDP